MSTTPAPERIPIPKKNFVSRRLCAMLGKRFPNRFKRLIYIASVMGVVQQVKDPDMTLVRKLNELFKVAEHPDAFVFPMYIKNIIWGAGIVTGNIQIDNGNTIRIHEVVQAPLTTQDCDNVGLYFALNAPDWLKYGPVDRMANDVMQLVKHLKRYMETSTPTAA